MVHHRIIGPAKYTEVGQRLNEFVKQTGEPSARQFALRAGITPAVLSNLILGHSMPGGETLAAIAAAFPTFDASYILTGRRTKAGFEVGIETQLPPPAPSELKPTQPGSGETGLRVNRDGELEGSLLVAELRNRLADKDRELDRVYDQLAAWQEAYRKPLASVEAAGYALPSPCNPIGPRFDGPARMWVNRQAA